MSSMRDNSDGQTPNGQPDWATLAMLAGFNGATVDRIRSLGDNADAVAALSLGVLRALGMGMVYNGATWDRVRTPNVFKPLNAVAIGTEAMIWTPTAGKKFRLMGFVLSVGTAAGNVVIKDNTAGTTILVLPKAVLDTPFISPPMGNGILSGTINFLLTATGVATATLSGFVFGTEE